MKSSDPKNEVGDERAWEGRDYGSMPLGFVLFGLIGATAATAAAGQLRRSVHWFYSQLNRPESYSTCGARGSKRCEEAWIRYRRRMQEMDENERERVERIRRMQSVFNRERNRYKQNQESWTDHETGYYQNTPRDDWYFKAEAYYHTNQRTNYRSTPQETGNFAMAHHYSVLGLDRYRPVPYSDAEIKSAFRKKAKEYHPDQNQNNTEVAGEKFKQVMMSYEAIKSQRQTGTGLC